MHRLVPYGLVSPASVDHCQLRDSGLHGIDLERVDGVGITHGTFLDVFHEAMHVDHDQFLQRTAAGIENDAPGEFADNT